MAPSVFAADGDRYVPSGHARGPWDASAMHGGAPAALIARAIERVAPQMRIARLTVEYLGSVPLDAIQVDAQITRPGRRIQVAEATLGADGRELCRARASLMRVEDTEGLAPDTDERIEPGPDHLQRGGFRGQRGEGFHLTAMDLRFAQGEFSTPGPAKTWFRLDVPLVDGEEPSPAQRAVAAADFGNGVSAALDWDEWLFVNTDLTVHLHREPDGEWVALDARTILEPNGSGLAVSTLHDRHGPVGRAAQTLFVSRIRS